MYIYFYPHIASVLIIPEGYCKKMFKLTKIRGKLGYLLTRSKMHCKEQEISLLGRKMCEKYSRKFDSLHTGSSRHGQEQENWCLGRKSAKIFPRNLIPYLPGAVCTVKSRKFLYLAEKCA